MTGLRGRRPDREVLRGARTLAAEGMVIGSVGNVSVRAGARVRVTPTAMPYDDMRRGDLVTVDLDGRVVAGGRAPSRELPLHLAVYKGRPDVAAIVHCHSVWATAWSFLGEPLGPATEEMTYYGIGEVRTARQAPTGSRELAVAAARTLGASKAVLLGGHGTLAAGETVAEAITVARAVEHQAHVAWLLRLAREPQESAGRPSYETAVTNSSLLDTPWVMSPSVAIEASWAAASPAEQQSSRT